LWATSGRVPGPGRAWLAVREIHAQAGLVPILLAYLHQDKRRDGRPRDSGELRRMCGPGEVDQPPREPTLEKARPAADNDS
jgi:hypothetical protein